MVDVGSVFEGQYEVVEGWPKVGAEKFFRARHQADGRPVHIRTVDQHASSEVRKNFSDVARLLSRLDHPGCLDALCVGQRVDGTLYIASEAFDGCALETHVGESMRSRELAEIGLQLFDALAYLHGREVHVGCLPPSGILLGSHRGAPRIKIADLTFAHGLGRGPVGLALPPEWSAPELDRSHPTFTEASDVFATGALLRAMSATELPDTLEHLLRRLTATAPSERPSATQAAQAFGDYISSSTLAFDRSWLAAAQPVGISASLPTVELTAPSDTRHSSPSLLASPAEVEPPPRRSHGTALGLGAAALAATAVIAWSQFSAPAEQSQQSQQVPSNPAPEQRPRATAAVARPAPLAAPTERTGETLEEKEVRGNPIVWLNEVNRRELKAVHGFEERKRLLDKLAERPAVYERVDHRWNALLDLWQASESKRPCTTFAAALASIDEGPQDKAERDLVERVEIPTTGPGEEAGACQELTRAFSDFVAKPKTADRSRARTSRSRRGKPEAKADERAATDPKPSVSPSPPEPQAERKPKAVKNPPSDSDSGVASRLDNGLRDL